MLTFYYAPGTCALASHLALEYAGAPYEAVRLDFRNQQQRSPEYLRVNPKGRVPALVTDRGAISENVAILQYVAQSFPAANLAPLDDPFLLAKVNEFNSYLASTVHVNHAHKGRGYRWVDAEDTAAIEAMKKKVPQTMAESFTLIEEKMLQGPWVLGERFSTADLYLFTIAGWLEGDGVDVQRFPKVAEHMARLAAAPQVQKVVAAQKA
ncbi:glutathione S-transferase family protein [Ramlibacter sp. USB13]|uniref:Glutathione S-transferase family protein n=1 Tax=Ramlibacter cellulosilyticus TaxID=2764187 RepID=A0A923SFG7_9BURK|nr:glutathione S-transferase family protein [Ramlibacter cellulosilyticus]MBC5783927.1 glutathione S-transferase family protein [Ramlibacter cellulosilyticus]